MKEKGSEMTHVEEEDGEYKLKNTLFVHVRDKVLLCSTALMVNRKGSTSSLHLGWIYRLVASSPTNVLLTFHVKKRACLSVPVCLCVCYILSTKILILPAK